MLSRHDADKIRKLKDDLDQATANFEAANRETEATERRLKQVRASIRPASRTRFTRWLTNSNPEEYRQYQEAKEEHKDQKQLVKQLKPRVTEKDEHINEAVEECLERSSQVYQRLITQKRLAADDRKSCEELRAMLVKLRGQVDATLTQAQRLRGRDTNEARKATDRTATQTAEEVSAVKKHLMELVPRLRAYGSFPTRQIELLRTEFSGGGSNFQTRCRELTTTRTALSTLHSSLASAIKRIAEHRRGFEKSDSPSSRRRGLRPSGADMLVMADLRSRYLGRVFAASPYQPGVALGVGRDRRPRFRDVMPYGDAVLAALSFDRGALWRIVSIIRRMSSTRSPSGPPTELRFPATDRELGAVVEDERGYQVQGVHLALLMMGVAARPGPGWRTSVTSPAMSTASPLSLRGSAPPPGGIMARRG